MSSCTCVAFSQLNVCNNIVNTTSNLWPFQEDQYERPEGHIDGASNYRRDYQGHYNLPSVRSQPFDPSKKTRKDTSAKFESRTTAKEHFKPWNSCPSKPFAELPSFTGSILYPEPGHQLDTTTGTTFQGALGRRSDPFSQEGNLKIEGIIIIMLYFNIVNCKLES